MSCHPQKEKQFNWENKLTQDKCALATKQTDNELVYDYNTFNFFTRGSCDTINCISDFAYDYPNLRFRNGYGVANECVIDDDSKMRTETLTHGRERQPLFTRQFFAVPDYGRGGLVPNTETFLQNGQDTTYLRQCDRVTEKNFDRFVPLVGCADVQKHDPVLESVGLNSRELLRQHRRSCQ